MKSVRVHKHGGTDVLVYEDVPMPKATPGEAVVKVMAAGVNFIDVYHRIGLYPQALPVTLGSEGAGVVQEVGADVYFRPGDTVAWAAGPGSYAEYVRVPASKLVKLHAEVPFDIAAAVMLQGMTAHYLAHSTFPLTDNDTCLVYAAAGGVGGLLTQIARMKGAMVIGTTSSEEKAEVARAAGADYVIRYDREDVASRVQEITEGRGVDVVYDSVGKTTWESSLSSLHARGMMVSFGNSSGPVGTIDPLALSRAGSLYLTRPTLAHYTATRQELDWRANDLFNWIAAGKLRVHIDRKVPLAQAAQAHQALEGRQTIGKVLLIP